jgi:hypothetical protein
MDRNDKIVKGMVATLVGVAGINVIRTIRQGRADRQMIRDESAETIRTIGIAQGRVMERIENGHYQGKSMNTILNDLKFEQMIARNKL